MVVVDGNALAGTLADSLGPEPTGVTLRCAGCGSLGVLGQTTVYRTAMGSVARCRGCDTVLVTVVESGARRWVGLPGARTMSAAVPDGIE
ncbi:MULTISPECIES: DUF6510 family protein [unclassified Curtobacterium]|uniref:DUF6510 family protein n=1 Tax=unclassified Curtobacterium TaxID=257496 RepID=UPI000D8494D3|nr:MULTISPECIES: DUF6510 family protein [unclassified Curtobacterium]PYY64647.1 hypothetical protein DEJ30_07195 [Curtobacterium sp. MCPF17_003]PZE68594.1 hypothetical protein DEJ27_09810 [Curtobacterium sp. MCPF17_018]PZF31181.1 hypothetical protein DEJ35_06860 [Curtobacterium sp. MCPF17_051]WIB69203.1 DUF6510 family protein [Curtobacterium sp. MCBD17_026]